MRTINPASDDGVPDELSGTIEELREHRDNVLGTMIDAHVGVGLLAGLEADRIALKRGADDPRVQILRDRADASVARVDALSVEREIATVRAPPPPSTGALVQGRITDTAQRAAGRVTVALVDEKGQAVAGVDPVDADDTGYYALLLTAEAAKAIGAGTKLVLLLRGGPEQLVPAAAKPFTIAPGATVLQDLMLSTAELERLRLRAPIAEPPVIVKPGEPAKVEPDKPEDKTAAEKAAEEKAKMDRAAAEKAAADKAAAEKAAADRAAADRAAADKEAAEKAAADKAAADKAEVDRAKADKAATEKAAADKAKADKAEKAKADKANADKAAADKAAADKAGADKTTPKGGQSKK